MERETGRGGYNSPALAELLKTILELVLRREVKRSYDDNLLFHRGLLSSAVSGNLISLGWNRVVYSTPDMLLPWPSSPARSLHASMPTSRPREEHRSLRVEPDRLPFLDLLNFQVKEHERLISLF